METMLALSIMAVGFNVMLLLVYFPLCLWLYADYRKRGGRKSLRRYMSERF